jgi:hypothetical protein
MSLGELGMNISFLSIIVGDDEDVRKIKQKKDSLCGLHCM